MCILIMLNGGDKKIIVYIDWFYNLCFTPYLGQLLLQFAALLSCHYYNSVLTVCLCLTLANKMVIMMKIRTVVDIEL